MAAVANQPNERAKYRRVPGLRFSGGRSTLRMTDDHLLLCDYRTGFTERYRRFYFRDIEAIIIRKSITWIMAIIAWFVVGLIFLMIATSASWNKWSTITIEAICGLFILRNLIRGPSCRTHVQTAVQTDLVPMLKRVRRTNRVLRKLFPVIEAAQGGRGENLPGSNMSILRETSAPLPTSPAARGILPPPSVATQHELSWIHVATFACVLLVGAAAIWEVKFPSTVSMIVLTVLFASSAIGGIIALVWQGKHRVHRGAATMVWLLIISFILGMGGIVYVFTMVNVMTNAPRARNRPTTFNYLSPFELRHMSGFEHILWIYAIWSILLALFGLIFAFIPPPAKAQPPPLPNEPRS